MRNEIFRVPLEDLPPEIREHIEKAAHDDEEPENPFQTLFGGGQDNGLSERGIIIINDDISKDSLAKASAKLWQLHFDDNWNDQVQIIINSPGGYLDACWAFIDVMNAVRFPIRTVAVGNIASAATMIFVNGDERVMSPNSTAMIHHFWTMTWGSYPELLASRKNEDYTTAQIVRHLIDHSKYSTRKQVETHLLLNQDNWLSPKEMKNHGLCDRVLPRRRKKKLKLKRKKQKK